MAIFRAAVVANNGGNTASTTVNFPTAASNGANMLLEDQFMILLVAASGGGIGTIPTPSGWNPGQLMLPTITNAGNNSGTFWVFWKRARQSDIITGSVTVASSYSNDFVTAYLLTFDDISTISPFAGIKVAVGGNPAKFVAPGAVTPLGAGCLAIIASMNSNNADVAAAGIPAGYTEAGHYYPSNAYRQSFVAVANAQTTDATPINDYLTWEGQYSQFAIQSLLIVLSPVVVDPVVLQSTEYAKAATAFLTANVEDAVTTPSAFPAITYRNWLQAMTSLFVGRDSGASGANPTFADISGTNTRFTATLDGANNRTAIAPNFS